MIPSETINRYNLVLSTKVFRPLKIIYSNFFFRLHTTAKAVSEAEYSGYGARQPSQGAKVIQCLLFISRSHW